MDLKSAPTLKFHPIRVGITMGDPSGIGPGIIAKALPCLKRAADFVVIGDLAVFYKNQKSEIRNQNFKFVDLNNVRYKNFEFGRVRAEYGRASIEYLDKALELIKHKEIDCLVTCPVSKEAINLAGFRFWGHTEYLAIATNTEDPVMLLLNRFLKVSLVTRHIPLERVQSQINRARIYKTVISTYHALRGLFLIKEPRIAVCGLNPHASDNGIIGKEENSVIKPALKKIKSIIKNIAGPLPADTAILKARAGVYDCLVAMYHDQALIPLKLSDAAGGVNLTLGLPFVRTSPLHGTAFDIAGTGQPCPHSLIEAINLALRCTQNQRRA